MSGALRNQSNKFNSYPSAGFMHKNRHVTYHTASIRRPSNLSRLRYCVICLVFPLTRPSFSPPHYAIDAVASRGNFCVHRLQLHRRGVSRCFLRPVCPSRKRDNQAFILSVFQTPAALYNITVMPRLPTFQLCTSDFDSYYKLTRNLRLFLTTIHLDQDGTVRLYWIFISCRRRTSLQTNGTCHGEEGHPTIAQTGCQDCRVCLWHGILHPGNIVMDHLDDNSDGYISSHAGHCVQESVDQ